MILKIVKGYQFLFLDLEPFQVSPPLSISMTQDETLLVIIETKNKGMVKEGCDKTEHSIGKSICQFSSSNSRKRCR